MKSASLHRKDEPVLFCLKAGNEEAKSAVLAQWPAASWNDLLRQAAGHGISAYVYHRLKTLHPPVDIPVSIQRRMREIALQNASTNIRLMHGLRIVLKTLENEGIPVIILKGTHLAERIYGNIALRKMIDADILVKSDSLQHAVTVLFRMGFKILNDELTGFMDEIKEKRFRVIRESKHFFDLVHPDWKLKLDVHCSLARAVRPFRIDTEGLWNRAIPASVEGAEAAALSPEDMLLYQCLHTSLEHHFRQGLRPFCDIFEILRIYRNEINWDKLQRRARLWGVHKCTFITLLLTKDLLGAEIPDSVLTSMKPGNFDPEMAAYARQGILPEQQITRIFSSDLIKFWKYNKLIDKMSVLLSSAFPSREVMALMYPASPDSLRMIPYYPVRWKDLLVRWGGTVCRLAGRDKQLVSAMEAENREAALEQWMISKD